MDTIVITYLSYVCLSVALTVWVAQTLHKNGRVFLVDVFDGNEALADSVNHLLVVGFYLINFGYVTLALKLGYEVNDRAGGHRGAFVEGRAGAARPRRDALLQPHRLHAHTPPRPTRPHRRLRRRRRLARLQRHGRRPRRRVSRAITPGARASLTALPALSCLSFVGGWAEAGGALEVGDDEANHAVGDVAREGFAQRFQALGADLCGGALDVGAVFRGDVARNVEGAAAQDAVGEVAFDRDLGQAALRANLFDRESLSVERVSLFNGARLRRGGRCARIRVDG